MSEPSNEVFSPRELRKFASEICADDIGIFVELIGDCRDDIDQQFAKMLEARGTGAWRDFNRAAHSIKSAARTFGSPLVKQLALELEKASEDGVREEDLPDLDRLSQRLRESADLFNKKLQEVAGDPDSFLA